MLTETRICEIINPLDYPWTLLLLADPQKEIVQEYIRQCRVLAVKFKELVIGVAAVDFRGDISEIKNIAVEPQFQRMGIATLLIRHVFKLVSIEGIFKVLIATANSSESQLRLYKSLGFEVFRIERDYFIKRYPQAIFENGIQARHKIWLHRGSN